MKRNIDQIAKTVHLIEELTEQLGMEHNSVVSFANHLVDENPSRPLIFLGDKFFGSVGKMTLLRHLIAALSESDKSDWTFKEFRNLVAGSNLRFCSAVPTSTSACQNLYNQHVLQAFLNFGDQRQLSILFSAAQKRDHEYRQATGEDAKLRLVS